MTKLAQEFSDFVRSPNLSIVLNTEGLYFLLFESRFRELVRNADLIFCDGIGLKFALQVSGVKNVKRLHGPDLFHEILHKELDKKQLIIGGSRKSHELLIAKYRKLDNNPNVKLYDAIIQEDSLGELFSLIEAFKPELIYVCLGILKQEYIGEKIREAFPQCSIVGIGASIDFESGNVKRSSRFFQKIGLEWLPRLLREPRMFPRQARALFGFLIYSILGVFRVRKNNVDLIKIINKNVI